MPTKKTTAALVTGALVLGAGAMIVAPAFADNSSTSKNPLSRIQSAISGLVSDGTITQDQADKVEAAIEKARPQGEGMGGHGGGHRGGPMGGDRLDVAAKTLGMTTAELETSLRSGKTLAEVAKAQNVSVDTLVKALVKDAQAKLAAAVKAGRLTQAQANAFSKNLTERITKRVNGQGPKGGDYRPHGNRGKGGPGMPTPASPKPTPASPASLV